MGLFSRNKESAAAVPAEPTPFEALRRSPRNTRKARVSAPSGPSDFDGGAPLDPAEASKTRARRRLIGAVALALAAIVFVPMLFDRTPVAPSDDIALQIPDRDTPFEGRRGVPDAARTPLRPASDLPSMPTITSPSTDAPAVQDTTSVAEPTSDKPVDPVPQPKVAIAPPAKAVVAEKPLDKPEKAKPPAPTVVATKTPDDPRALAALDGKDDTVTTTAGDRQYAVQIAAFSTPDRARGLRDQLVANGLKSYVESVSTAQGLRTRVRLGPFASRDAADRAKQKLKTLKLDGSVVPL